MRRLLILIVAIALVLGLASAAMAAPLYVLTLGPGARAMGMAGAFVAIADDGTAAYWNPAGITQIKIVGITPSLGAAGDWTDLQTSPGDEWPPNLGNGDLQLNGMIGTTFHGFAVSLVVGADGFMSYFDDSTYQTSFGGVGVLGTGLVTLAHDFGNIFALGANIKGFYGQRLSYMASNDPVSPWYPGGYIESAGTGYGVDVGALFKVGKLLRIGAVVENAYSSLSWDVTEYGFYDDGTTYVNAEYTEIEELSPVLHVGLAIKAPVIGTLIAVQMDKPLDDGLMTYRLGIEQSILLLKLRAGTILDDNFEVANYTAGVGFKLGPLVMDVGAVADTDLTLQAGIVTMGFTF